MRGIHLYLILVSWLLFNPRKRERGSNTTPRVPAHFCWSCCVEVTGAKPEITSPGMTCCFNFQNTAQQCGFNASDSSSILEHCFLGWEIHTSYSTDSFTLFELFPACKTEVKQMSVRASSSCQVESFLKRIFWWIFQCVCFFQYNIALYFFFYKWTLKIKRR